MHQSIHGRFFSEFYPKVRPQECSVGALIRNVRFLAIPFPRHDQATIRQCDASGAGRPRTDRLFGEGGVRRGLLVVTHRPKIVEPAGFQRKSILGLQIGCWIPLMKHPRIIPLDEAVGSAILGVLCVVERKGVDKRIAEADVRKERLARVHTKKHMIEFGSGAPSVENTSGIHRHLESECFQKPGEQAVQLITKPSASSLDDLFE